MKDSARKKPLPIGNEDFKEIIEKGYYYVDKTLFIKELLDNGSKVSLFTRPRRFGKTLALSMLRYFSNIQKRMKTGTYSKDCRLRRPVPFMRDTCALIP